MKKFFRIGLAILTSTIVSSAAKADSTNSNTVNTNNEPQAYALDKLANAQAQLDKLVAQREALDNLIRAVRKDLRAAKMRAKAERIQVQADSDRQDASILVQQNGVAVDLPNLMTAKGVQAGIVEYQPDPTEIELMFRDKNSTTNKTVFFPGGDAGKKIEPSNIR